MTRCSAVMMCAVLLCACIGEVENSSVTDDAEVARSMLGLVVARASASEVEEARAALDDAVAMVAALVDRGMLSEEETLELQNDLELLEVLVRGLEPVEPLQPKLIQVELVPTPCATTEVHVRSYVEVAWDCSPVVVPGIDPTLSNTDNAPQLSSRTLAQVQSLHVPCTPRYYQEWAEVVWQQSCQDSRYYTCDSDVPRLCDAFDPYAYPPVRSVVTACEYCAVCRDGDKPPHGCPGNPDMPK